MHSLKQYRYTKNNVHLTDDQRDFYEENGFILFRNLVDWRLVDECRQHFIDYCNQKNDAVVGAAMKDVYLKTKNVKGEYLINKIQDLLHDDVFFKYSSYGPILDIVESIIGPNITCFQAMLINKPPHSKKDASRHPLHQDLHYFPLRPSHSIVASWTAMEKATEQNGCLFVIPGSHKGELLPHDYPPNVKTSAFHGALGVDDSAAVNLVMDKGDTVFFHPLLFHGSGPNLTTGFRKALSSHYADSNSNFIDLTGTGHENVQIEANTILNKRGYGISSLQEYIKLSSKLLRGKPGSFQKLSHL